MVEEAYFILHLAIILIVAITLHEFGHAAAALYLGDDTAARLGRVSLNPLRHLDPLGSLCFILFKFGWGKPVPVNLGNLRNPRRDHALVALAGPMMNLFQAFVFAAIMYHQGLREVLEPVQYQSLINFLNLAVFINCTLMVFNLLPFPPLDGGAIAGLLIKDPFKYAKFQQQAPPIFFAVVLIGMITGIPIFSTITMPLVQGLLQIMNFMLG